jgi:hypothetical protein
LAPDLVVKVIEETARALGIHHGTLTMRLQDGHLVHFVAEQSFRPAELVERIREAVRPGS